MENNWYQIKAIGHSAEIYLFGEIGAWGISAKDFIDELKQYNKVRNIIVRINSMGGDVFDGNAIFNSLKNHSAHVTTSIEGAAFSMGSVIAMAGDTIKMAENSLLMIHNPTGVALGGSDDMRKTADIIDKVKNTIVGAYTTKTGMSYEEISNLMDDETWFDAEEAKEFGFVDEITEEIEMAASFDLSKYKNVPAHITAKLNKLTTKEIPMVTKSIDLNSENKRRDDIRNRFLPFKNEYPDLLNECLLDHSITSEQAGDKLLTALGQESQPVSGEPHMDFGQGTHQANFMNAAKDALLQRNGIRLENPNPAARDLNRMSLVNMAEQCLKLKGVNTQGMNTNLVIKNAISHTSGDFPNLLANVAGKSLNIGYEMEPASYRVWTKEDSANDFKVQAREQLSEAPALDIVTEGSEYKYGTFGEAKEQFQLLTYGKLFSITRQAIINDDLSAFTRLPQAFGATAVRKEGDLVYTVLTANANMSDGTALFHASHNNLETAAALSLTSLGSARTAMRIQTGINGATLNVVPRYLIVPAALETLAEQLIASLVDPSKSNDTSNAAFIRGLTLVVDARLDANSTTAWYLAANQDQIETVIRAYLSDQEGPFYEERVGFNVDGLEFKARIDFAAKALDWRGLVKNPGL